VSQHFCRTKHLGRPVCILMGWDRPLQRHFLVVSYTDLPRDADDEYLGHASIATTTIYSMADRDKRLHDIEKFYRGS